MDPELVKTVFAAVRDRWEESEEPFSGREVQEQLENVGLSLSDDTMERIWAYLADLDAIEIAEEEPGAAPTIENVDVDWSPPHTQVPRI